jgi:hypothetical protein
MRTRVSPPLTFPDRTSERPPPDDPFARRNVAVAEEYLLRQQ